jgi:predicted  nucleic acid-binding Zn-ribbon protein
MASRSGSNGTIIGLVIFVLATVGLLVTSIVLWSKYDDARKAAEAARGGQSESDRKADEATQRLGQAVALMVGRTDASVEELRKEFEAGENDVVKTMLDKARSDASKLRKDLAAASDESKRIQQQLDVAMRRIDEAKQAYDAALEAKGPEFSEREEAIAKTQAELDELKSQLSSAREEVASAGRAREEELQGQLEALEGEKNALESRAGDLQRQVDRIRVQPKNSAALVDGHVLASNAEGRVYIDLGRKHRIRPGMTFEVYADAVGAGVDPSTGAILPGKASIEVLKVDETTSTARVIRQQRGASPPVKDDVLVNAIYSPDYTYRFFLYGEFDTDADGRTSAEEKAFVIQRIRDWGGTVAEGDDLPGDVDFVLVGVEPAEPRGTLSDDASIEEIEAVSQARERRVKYLGLVDKATDARIPILNWNRLRTLTGDAER